jgi:cobalamin biosynthesis Mg chelatase CobN
VLGVIVEAPVRTADDEINSLLAQYRLPNVPFGWLVRFIISPFRRIENAAALIARARSMTAPLLVLQGSDVFEKDAETARVLADSVTSSAEYVQVDCPLTDGEDLASVEAVDRAVRDFLNACIAQSERRRPTLKSSSTTPPRMQAN